MNSKVKCKVCKKYVLQNDALKFGLSSFCSRDCYLAQVSTSQRPKKMAPRPKVQLDGPSQETIQKIKARDMYRCRNCHSRNGLVLHHIFYRSEAKKEPWLHQSHNLITLCNHCHLSIVHQNKRYYQPLLLALVWLSEVEKRYLTVNEFEKYYDFK